VTHIHNWAIPAPSGGRMAKATCYGCLETRMMSNWPDQELPGAGRSRGDKWKREQAVGFGNVALKEAQRLKEGA
jgi:hypothetical protein